LLFLCKKGVNLAIKDF